MIDCTREIRVQAYADAMLAYLRVCGGEGVLKAADMGIDRSQFMAAVAVLKKRGKAERTGESTWRLKEAKE